MYQIIINNEVVKTYPHRLQCVIWCYLHGRVVSGNGYRWLIKVEIKKNEILNLTLGILNYETDDEKQSNGNTRNRSYRP